MDTEALASVLEGEGFSPYQARAYVALLELGSVSASGLADASGVPQPRIYDVVRALEEQGYVETYEQENLHVRVPSPEAVVSSLRNRVDELQAAASEVEARWTRPEPRQHEVSVVSRFETLCNRAEAFIGSADHRVQLSVTPGQFRDLYSALTGALERGVAVQVSIHSCSRDVATSLPLADVATEARWREREAPFLAIVDQHRVCYAEHVGGPREYGVVVNDRTHAAVFIWYYLSSVWELWEPLVEDDRSFPRTYIDIRRAAHELVPHLQNGDDVYVSVDGHLVETGEACEFAGCVVDIAYEGRDDENDGPRSLQSLAGQTSLVVATDDGEVTVGGFGAVLEDVEAERVVVEDVV
ncbi:TrmB family transcriptional regulator [Halarchaeum sp. P4]|uniref:TrmB family transcriptional regulator n=1 Tax=Halarchaeum sp. P4 TaxID=3421639 RepID=UPI003EC019EF